MARRGRPLGTDGARAYRALHGLDAPARAVPFRLPRAPLVDLYRVTALEGERLQDEGLGAGWIPYRHEFARGHGPHLVADADGWGHLYGGRYEITDHGVEDTMRRYHHGFHHGHHGGHFVPMHMHFRRNPDGSAMLRGVLAIGAGLVGGVAVSAAIRALPESKVSANVKDGISIAAALAAAMLPGPGTGRMVGVSLATALALGVVNRRYSVSERVASYVEGRARDVYDRLLPGGTASCAPTTSASSSAPAPTGAYVSDWH